MSSSWLGNQCACGWSMTEISYDEKNCERCGRTAKFQYGFWNVSRPTKTVERLKDTKDNRSYEKGDIE